MCPKPSPNLMPEGKGGAWQTLLIPANYPSKEVVLRKNNNTPLIPYSQEEMDKMIKTAEEFLDNRKEDRTQLWTEFPSAAEIELENYCASKSNPMMSLLVWSNCGNCENIFRSNDDYLCESCRNS